jgi:hypothetical protein
MSKILIRNNISKTDGTHFFISKTQSRSHGDFLRDALFVNYSIYYCLNEKEFSKIIINLKITLKKLLYYKGYINDTIDNELKDAVYNFLVDEGLYNEFEDISFNKIISNKVFNESIEKANTRVN